MANTLNGFTKLVINLLLTGDNNLGDPYGRVGITKNQSWTDGTSGALTARFLYYATRSAAAAAENLDLAGGLTNAFGETITFTKLRGIYIFNNATTTAFNLAIGGHASGVPGIFSNLNDEIIVPPSSPFFLANTVDTWTVTAGSGDILTVDPGANTISYDIVLWGY